MLRRLVVLVHQPDWGYVDGENARWTELANRSGVDLVIAGHRHRYQRIAAGERGGNYPTLVLDQDQLARVDATGENVTVTVTGKDGVVTVKLVVSREPLASSPQPLALSTTLSDSTVRTS
jgi:hypothetical protein